jgi:hypothetical protein
LNETSTISDFESFLSESELDCYLEISSRYSDSAYLIFDLIQLSKNNNDLWFLTAKLSADDPFQCRLMPFNCYENYILAIQNLVLWSKNNTDKVSVLIGGGWNEDDVKKAVDCTFIRKSFERDYLDPDSLFSYLSSVVQMLRYAISKQMSIICMSYLG